MASEINFRFLRELQRKERENAELQKLPDDFLDQLRTYIKRKVDLLSKPEMLTFTEKKEIENLKPVIKYIFDKREQKIVISALRAARTGIKPKNMLPHEEALFNALKTEIVKNRLLLDDLLMLIDPAHRSVVHIEITEEKRVEEEIEKSEEKGESVAKEVEMEKKVSEVEKEKKEAYEVKEEKKESEAKAKEQKGEIAVGDVVVSVEIIKDVPAFIGIDLNKYGPWKKGQVVTLPEKIAKALIKTGRAKEPEG